MNQEKIRNLERKILIGMITNSDYLKKIAPVAKKEYFESGSAPLVLDWILEYHKKFQEAPGKNIQSIFDDHSDDLNPQQRDWMIIFLDSLSSEFSKKGFNVNYFSEKTLKYFDKQGLTVLGEKLIDLADRNRITEARDLISRYIKVPSTVLDLGVEPFNLDFIAKAFTQEESRVKFYLGIPQLDKLTGPAKSGWLTAFLGPMKRGKTHAILHSGISATSQGLGSVIVSLETEEIDNALRIWASAGSLVINTDRGKKSRRSSEYVVFPYYSKTGKIRQRRYKRPSMTKDSVERVANTFNKIMPGRLIIKTFPMYSAGVDDIDSYIESLEVFKDFYPGFIGVDYLGILRAPRGAKGRDVYNENTMMLKGLGQKYKAVTQTGHQGTKKALEKMNITVIDIPEEIRFLAHVDILYSLNQTDDEKDENKMRIGLLAHRHRKFSKKKQVEILQQFETGQFHLDNRVVDTPKPVEKNSGMIGKKAEEEDED